jgi:hypothetical protein
MRPCRLAIVLLACLLAQQSALAESKATGSVSFLGRTIEYKVIGDVAEGKADSAGGECIVKINLNGVKHELRITEDELNYKGKKIPLKSYEKMEIIAQPARGKKEAVRVLLDGRQIFPKK